MLEKGIHLNFFLNYCDSVFTLIMRKEGKYTYCPEIHVDHQHWSVGKAQLDGAYEFAKTKFEEDKKAFEETCKKLKLC
jgi:GT2 family glycosyltransferase